MNRDELEERILTFSKNLITILGKLPKNMINNRLIDQVVRSGTSIGANYREANAGESPRDFKHKINISFKEAKETRYWLDILVASNSNFKQSLLPIRQESDELARIFGKAVSTCKQNAQLNKIESKIRNATS